MSKRILVTGGAGFIGSHLAKELIQRGYEVVVLDNETTGHREAVPEQAVYIKGDVREMADLDRAFQHGIDAVCHIAGQASIRLSFSDPTADLDTNTRGTVNVIRQCLSNNVPRLLFASSMTIYGNPEQIPTPESAPIDPVAYYGITKYAAERYVHLTAARKDITFPFNVTSFRMFNVYGVGQSLTNAYQGVLAIFIGRVLRGEPIVIHSDGEQARDFVHITDVVRAWADAIEDPRTYQQVMNIGAGKARSITQLCDLVLGAFGYTRETYPVNYESAQPGDIRLSVADIRHAREVFGWEPRKPFDEGIIETIEWAKTAIPAK